MYPLYKRSEDWIAFIYKLVVALAVLYFAKYIYETNFSRTARLLNKFPGARSWPIIGNTSLFFCNPFDIPGRITKQVVNYGRCFRFWFHTSPAVMIADFYVAEKILSSPNLVEKSTVYKTMNIYFGQGLVTAPKTKWRKDRKELNGGLKFNLFDEFYKIFNKYGTSLRDRLVEDFQQVTTKDLIPYLANCTLEATFEATLGKTSDDLLNKKLLLDTVACIEKASTTRILQPWLDLPFIWDIYGMGKVESQIWEPCKQDLIAYIQSKKEKMKIKETQTFYATEPSSTSFIDILLNSGSSRSSEDILDHVVTMMGAGTDTTAYAMNYTLYLLALNPTHQDKVHQELDAIFVNGINRNITATDLAQMKYLEMCIKESLRLYPPVPMFSRLIQSDLKLDEHLTIPKGSTAIIWPYELHRDPRVYPDPEVFQPDRFSPEVSVKRTHYAYLPFSAGSRNCMGQKFAMMEMKVVLAYILSTFQLGTRKSRKDLKLRYGIVLEPHEGIPLSLKLRNHN